VNNQYNDEDNTSELSTSNMSFALQSERLDPVIDITVARYRTLSCHFISTLAPIPEAGLAIGSSKLQLGKKSYS